MTDNNDFSYKNEDTFYDNEEENKLEEEERESELEKEKKEKKGRAGRQILDNLENNKNIEVNSDIGDSVKLNKKIKRKRKIIGKKLFKALKDNDIEKFKNLVKKNGLLGLDYKPNNGNKTIFTIAEEKGLKKEMIGEIKENINLMKEERDKKLGRAAGAFLVAGISAISIVGLPVALVSACTGLGIGANALSKDSLIEANEAFTEAFEKQQTTNQEIGR